MKRIIGMFMVVAAMLIGQVFATSQSVDLSASGMYLDIADDSQTGLGITGNFTIETWVKFSSITPEYTFWMASKYYPVNGSRSFFWFMSPSSDGLKPGSLYYFDQSGNCTGVDAGDSAIIKSSDLNTWVHLAVSVEVSTGTVKFYKNGVLFQSPLPTYLNAHSVGIVSRPFAIGVSWQNPSVYGYFKDYRFWNTARTAQEISANYNHELSGAESGLVAYWKFNGNTLDATSNNNTLTAHGTISCLNDVPMLIPSQISLSHQYIHFSPIPGVISNGFPEIAALKVSSNLTPLIKILDGSNNQELSSITFFDSLWVPKKVTVFDINNDSTPEISVMASKGDSTKIESRSLNSGVLVKTIILP